MIVNPGGHAQAGPDFPMCRPRHRKRVLFCLLLVATSAGWSYVGWRLWLIGVYRGTLDWAGSYGGMVFWTFESGRVVGEARRSRRTPEWLTEKIGLPVLDDIAGIRLSGSPGIASEEWERLGRLPDLRWLVLEITTLDDHQLAVLASLEDLEWLETGGGGKVTNEGLRTIASLENLRGLDLGPSAWDGEGLRFVGEMTRLEELTLADDDVRDEDLRHLGNLTALSWLDIGQTAVGDSGLDHLATLGQIEALCLGPGITDAAIARLIEFPRLERIEFLNSEVTDEGVERLVEGAPKLRHLGLFGTLVSGTKLGELELRGYSVQATY